MKEKIDTQSQTALRFIGYCEKHQLCPHEAMNRLLDLALDKPVATKEVVATPAPRRKYKRRHAPHPMLKGEAVKEMRAAILAEPNVSYKRLGKKFGTSAANVYGIVRGRNWVNTKLAREGVAGYISPSEAQAFYSLVTQARRA